MSNSIFFKLKTRSFFFFLLLCTFCASALARPAVDTYNDYEEEMLKLISRLDTASTVEDYRDLANSFQRLALIEKEEWHPLYYEALCLLAQTFLLDDAGARDLLIDESEKKIEVALALGGKTDELQVLKARMYQARLFIDPPSRSLELGPKIIGLLRKVTAENLDNPRAKFLLGQTLYYGPESFGGGSKESIAIVKSSLALFEKFKIQNPLDPNWGYSEASSFIARFDK